VYFLHGLQRAILSRVNANAGGRTFFYRFDCESGLNFVKKLTKTENFVGAAHWDDLTYIWWSDPELKLIDALNIDNELKMVNMIVGLFTNFATNGDTETNQTPWDSVASTELPLKCLNISEKAVEVIDFPETERLKVDDKSELY
jgi:carboxylesterase type B